MNRACIASLIFILAFSNLLSGKEVSLKDQRVYFLENKGQISDQFANPRNDIQFLLKSGGLTVFIGNGQLHYQFSKCLSDCNEKEIGKNPDQAPLHNISGPGATLLPLNKIQSYRLDVELIGADQNASFIAENSLPYYENYYLPGCPAYGTQAHAFQKITYKNIYPGINWVIYINGSSLEHEFVVGPEGNAADIKLKYSGQTNLIVNSNGSIIATTPLGTINEKAPVCYNSVGITVPSAYQVNGDIVTYNIKESSQVTIDPALDWATYYGPDSSTTESYCSICDRSGHIYSCGLTWAATNIATSGSYQTVYAGGADAFLLKSDTAGGRVWCTYYGGTGGDWGTGIAFDPAGQIYMGGVTQGSLTGIATPGAQQTVYGGGLEDGFLAKFTPAGLLKWATYMGGSGAEIPAGVACDQVGHVYLGSFTTSGTNVSTPGSYMPLTGGGYEDCLVQYDTAGTRQWGTYYGGSGDEFGGSVCTDGFNVYITGYTSSAATMSTLGCWQSALNGTTDAFIAKFNQFGVRLWGTYYGGEETETAGNITCDASNNILVLGTTGSNTAIASPGCFQPVSGGGTDCFLLKMEPELGHRIWCTYYGGPLVEENGTSALVTDDSENVYIGGNTPSTSGIATSRAWQTTYGGGEVDGFFAKFNSAGARQWSTYYGGSGKDYVNGCAFDGKNVYISGYTNSPNNIATPGSFLDAGGGFTFYFQAFLAKFAANDTPDIALFSPANQVQAGSLNLYPDPAVETFHLSGRLSIPDCILQITVSDLTGRIIQTEYASLINGSVSKQIYLKPGLPNGAYLVSITAPGYSSVLKLIRQ